MSRTGTETISQAVELLIEAAHPEKIILFGSQALGSTTQDSDVDLLIVLPHVDDRHAEMVRLDRVLAPLRVPIDVLVYTPRDLEQWGHVVGHVLHEALTEGIVLHEAAA